MRRVCLKSKKGNKRSLPKEVLGGEKMLFMEHYRGLFPRKDTETSKGEKGKIRKSSVIPRDYGSTSVKRKQPRGCKGLVRFRKTWFQRVKGP